MDYELNESDARLLKMLVEAKNPIKIEDLCRIENLKPFFLCRKIQNLASQMFAIENDCISLNQHALEILRASLDEPTQKSTPLAAPLAESANLELDFSGCPHPPAPPPPSPSSLKGESFRGGECEGRAELYFFSKNNGLSIKKFFPNTSKKVENEVNELISKEIFSSLNFEFEFEKMKIWLDKKRGERRLTARFVANWFFRALDSKGDFKKSGKKNDFLNQLGGL